MTGAGWTPERVGLLIALHAQGLSGSQIGLRLCISRSAAIAKLNRLGFGIKLPTPRASRSEAAALKAAQARSGAPAEAGEAQRKPHLYGFLATNMARKVAAKPGQDYAKAGEENVPPTARPWLERRFGECAFPVAGLGADTLSCCTDTDGATYCAAHRKIMIAEAPPPRRGARRMARRAA